MSSEWERRESARSDARRLAILIAVDYGLVEALEALGGSLSGFSVNFRGQDVLMTIRMDFDLGSLVAFVGADGLGNLFVKAAKEAAGNKLQWREDRFS